MGLLSWLFPSADDRVARARKAIAAGRPHEARLEVLDLDHPDAKAVLAEAENALALKNLDAAVGYATSGDDARAAEHLALAEKFHRGGHEEAFTATRRQLREIRTSRDAREEAEKAEKQARMLAVDPLGLAGPSFFDVGGAAPDPDREELEQRLALVVESYPEALRGGVARLGRPFADALLDLEDGRADLALQALVQLPDHEPLVCWERARASHLLGDPAAAAQAARAFARHADGHRAIGNDHSAVFLAQRLVETGDHQGALRVLREVRAQDPKVGGVLYAQLLALTGQLPEAENVLVALVREHPRTPFVYSLLARVRVAGGHRVEAMRALEASLEAVCCTPGKCGSQAPDLDTHRLLATLYLEDGRDLPRALDLAATAMGLVQQPTVDDVYLRALVARVRGEPDADTLARRVLGAIPDDHPAAERMARHLAVRSTAGA